MPPESILEKIKKLQMHAESAKSLGSDNEAEAFAAKVQELLIQHKLEASVLEGIDLNKDNIEINVLRHDWNEAGIATTKKRNHWLVSLSATIAMHHGCKILTENGSNRILVIGTEVNRTVVSYLLTVLAREGKDRMEQSYRKAYYEAKKSGETYDVKGYRRGFMTGYVDRIHQRLKEQRNKMLQDSISERGLVIIDKEAQAADDFLDNMRNDGLITKTSSMSGRTSFEGYLNGEKAGEDVNIDYNALPNEKRAKIQ